MTLNKIILGVWRWIRKLALVRINILLSMLVFLLRDFFLGFDNANNYLKFVCQSSIIPILRIKGAKIGEKCNIQSGITIHNCKDYSRLAIGSNCHIGKNCFLDLRGNITIEDNVVIAMNNTFITHLDMNNSDLKNIYQATQSDIVIKDGVYIGTNCTVLMGVTIGSKAVVGAKSLVNNDVDEKHIYVGSPATKIKKIDGI